jgi:succinyl-CoA synthetase beta subunit
VETPAVLAGGTWGDPIALESFLEGGKLRIPSSRRTATREEAEKAAAGIGFPLVLKLERGSEPHKRKAGLLRTVTDARELPEAVRDLASRARSGDRWLLQRRVPAGPELWAGFLDHPTLGPFVGFGSGGVNVERERGRVRWLSLPAPAAQAERFLSGLASFSEAGLPALRELLRRLASLALAGSPPAMAEVNPAIVEETTGTVWIVDARWQPAGAPVAAEESPRPG